MPEPVHIDRIPDDQHNPVPKTLAPSLLGRGLMATGIAAALNAVGFHIVNAAGANMIVATARTKWSSRSPCWLPRRFARARRRRDMARRPTRRAVRTWFAWIGLVHAAATVVVPILHRAADGDRIAVRDHVHIIAGVAWFAASRSAPRTGE